MLIGFFPEKSQGFDDRVVLDGEKYGLLAGIISEFVPRPGRHYEEVSPAPIEPLAVDDAVSLTFKYMVDDAGGVPVRPGVDAGTNQLDPTGHGG